MRVAVEPDQQVGDYNPRELAHRHRWRLESPNRDTRTFRKLRHSHEWRGRRRWCRAKWGNQPRTRHHPVRAHNSGGPDRSRVGGQSPSRTPEEGWLPL